MKLQLVMFCILGNFVIMVDKERIVAAFNDEIIVNKVSGEFYMFF